MRHIPSIAPAGSARSDERQSLVGIVEDHREVIEHLSSDGTGAPLPADPPGPENRLEIAKDLAANPELLQLSDLHRETSSRAKGVHSPAVAGAEHGVSFMKLPGEVDAAGSARVELEQTRYAFRQPA